MFRDKEFWYGAAVAAIAIYAYHHYIHPLPGAAKG